MKSCVHDIVARMLFAPANLSPTVALWRCRTRLEGLPIQADHASVQPITQLERTTMTADHGRFNSRSAVDSTSFGWIFLAREYLKRSISAPCAGGIEAVGTGHAGHLGDGDTRGSILDTISAGTREISIANEQLRPLSASWGSSHFRNFPWLCAECQRSDSYARRP